MAVCSDCYVLPVQYECPHCGVGHCDYCRVRCDSCETLYCEECIEVCFSCPNQRKQVCRECRVVCACHNAAFCRICDKTFRCAHCDKLWCKLFSNDKHEAEHYRRFIATYFVMGLRCNGNVTESVSHALKSLFLYFDDFTASDALDSFQRVDCAVDHFRLNNKTVLRHALLVKVLLARCERLQSGKFQTSTVVNVVRQTTT